MAPLPPTGRAGALEYLRASPETDDYFPIGGPTVQGGIIYEEGVWRLRRAGFDEDGWKAFCAAQQAAKKPIYPEHADDFRVDVVELQSLSDRFVAAGKPALPESIADEHHWWRAFDGVLWLDAAAKYRRDLEQTLVVFVDLVAAKAFGFRAVRDWRSEDAPPHGDRDRRVRRRSNGFEIDA